MRASMMQLERPQGDRTCIVINSLAAIASSNEAFNSPAPNFYVTPALKLKRAKLEKVTKRNLGSEFETPWSDELWQEEWMGSVKSEG